MIVGALFIMPPGAAKRPTVHPVYTVDLVGGAGPQPPAGQSPAAATEKPPLRGRTEAETAAPPATEVVTQAADTPKTEPVPPEPAEPEPQAPEPKPEVAQPEPEAPVPEPVTKEEPDRAKESEDVAKAPDPPKKKPEQVAQPELPPAPSEKPAKAPEQKPESKPKPDVAQKAPKPAQPEKEPVKKEPVKKEVAKKTPVKPRTRPRVAGSDETKRTAEVSNRDEAEMQRLRERRIQAAVAKVRERARKQGASSVVSANDASAPTFQAGTGRGRGAGVGDGVGDGGGELRSLEFVIYRNRMLDQIKSRWTWVGKRTDLEVTVRFGVDSNGDVFALQIVGASGDGSYDESVIRAVKRASPLPPPPTTYLRDFSDVELTFRPKDLSG